MIGTGYELTKAFYAEVEQNEVMQIQTTAFHHSLYTWICELRNRLQREVVDLPVKYTMQMAFIGSDKTLKKCIEDLEKWGIIEILQRGSNQHVPTKAKIAIAFLRKHCDSDAKANQVGFADLRQQYDSDAKAVRTTKTNKTIKTNKPPQSPKGDEMAQLLSAFPYQSEAFKTAWQEWEQFRREQKKKLTLISVNKQLKQLAQHSEAEAIAMIEQSIRNGWQGLFELSHNARNGKPSLPLPTQSSRPTSLTNIR